MSNVVGKATLEFGADGSSVKSEVREIVQEVNTLAPAAAAASVKAAASLSGVGTAAEGAAQKLTTAQQRARQSLERMANTLGRTRAEVAEYRAVSAGLPREVYEPLVARIREAEAAMGGMAGASRTAAAASTQLAETEEQTTARLRGVAAVALERADALQRQVESARAAAAAERDLAGATSRSGRGSNLAVLSGQNRGFQELARDINEVNAALSAIDRGAGSQATLQAQTDKLISLWGQGRITAEQYEAAVKRLDASEASLARSSAQAAAQGDRFIAGLREQAETAGMTARQILEYRAAQLGVSDRAGPLISRLAQVNKSLDGTGVSARQTAAAMRMVPAQMTDIVTQLAGGQNPLLILIQQGGQLKDSFGGIGPMFRALVGMITPFALAAGGVAAALTAVALAARGGASEASEFGKALALTGSYAGSTAGQLGDMARGVAGVSSTVGRASDVIKQLVTSGRVTGGVMDSVASAIVNMSETGAASVDSLVAQFVRLGESPSQAIAKINESMHFLDAATYERIRALEEQGKREQAAALAQSTLADATNRAAERVRESAGTLERGWISLKLAARQAWDAMLNIGRPTPISELRKQAAELTRTVESLENNQGFSTNDGGAATGAGRNRSQQALRLRKQELAAITEEIARQEQAEAGARGQALKAQAEQEKIAAQDRLREMQKATRSRAEVRAAEIAQMRRDAEVAGWTAQQIADAEKRISDKYKDPKGAGSTYKDDAATRRLAALREQEAALTAQLQSEDKLTEAGKTRAEFEREIADLKAKKVLTVDQKSLLANQDAIRAQMAKNEAISKELAAKQAMLKLDERAAQIQAAMASSAESRQEQYDRQLGAAGLGDVARQRVEAERSIRLEYRRYQDQLAKATPKDQLGSDRFRAEQQKIQEAMQVALQAQREYYAEVDTLNADWRNGARSGLENYRESVADVAAQTKSLFANAFQGMEDAITKAVTTGKMQFRDLFASIAQDMARLAIRQGVTGPLAGLLSSLFGGITAGAGYSPGGAALTSFDGLSGVPGRAIGGPVSPRSLYEVAEGGRPELLHQKGRTYLMSGSDGGYVTPITQTAQPSSGVASGVHVTVNVAGDGRSSTDAPDGFAEFGQQIGAFVDQRFRELMGRSNRQGGLLWNTRNGRA